MSAPDTIPTCEVCCKQMVSKRNGTTGTRFWGCVDWKEHQMAEALDFAYRHGKVDPRDEEFEGPDYDPDFDFYPDPHDLGYDGDG